MANDLIQLRCPDCARMVTCARNDTDPPEAVEAVLQCDRCDDGDWHSPDFYDAEGNWLHPTEHLSHE